MQHKKHIDRTRKMRSAVGVMLGILALVLAACGGGTGEVVKVRTVSHSNPYNGLGEQEVARLEAWRY